MDDPAPNIVDRDVHDHRKKRNSTPQAGAGL
jgi:hypothetical protein